MRILRVALAIFAMAVIVCAATHHAVAASGDDDVRQFVDNVGRQVLSVVNGGGAQDQKQQQLRQLFAQNVDIDWMGQFVLGHALQQANPDQRNRYSQAYHQYLLAIYTTNFSDYAGSQYTITSVRPESNGVFMVGMQIKSPNAREQDIQAGYRVRAGNGGFKITDIIIDGLSLITTQRSEFASVVQQKGLDGLIGDLEAKTKAGSVKMPADTQEMNQ